MGPHYTILVKLPFERGDFIDPPQNPWGPEKDQQLWELLSQSSSKGQALNWPDLARRFEVDLAFLSQQAALLYETQLSQVRAQLRNANRPSSAFSTSAVGGSTGLQDQVSAREQTPSPETRPARALNLSRKSSSATVTQVPASSDSQTQISSPDAHPAHKARRFSRGSTKRSTEVSPKLSKPAMGWVQDSTAIESSASESDTPYPVTRSRMFVRRRNKDPGKPGLEALSDAEEAEHGSPFLPFSTHQPVTPPKQLDATMEKNPDLKPADQAIPLSDKTDKMKAKAMRTINSSSSSNQSQGNQRRQSSQTRLSHFSPQHRRLAREAGSDDTPSMGSSFSDLDEASVTQSAMEEALAGEMQTGVVSRMSSISQALRSKYNF